MNRVDKLKSQSSCSKFSGIMECIENKNVSVEEKKLLIKLKADKAVLGGRFIGSYAKAALVLLGFERQTNDEDAIFLINSLSR